MSLLKSPMRLLVVLQSVLNLTVRMNLLKTVLLISHSCQNLQQRVVSLPFVTKLASSLSRRAFHYSCSFLGLRQMGRVSPCLSLPHPWLVMVPVPPSPAPTFLGFRPAGCPSNHTRSLRRCPVSSAPRGGRGPLCTSSALLVSGQQLLWATSPLPVMGFWRSGSPLQPVPSPPAYPPPLSVWSTVSQTDVLKKNV